MKLFTVKKKICKSVMRQSLQVVVTPITPNMTVVKNLISSLIKGKIRIKIK